jgi:transcriptional regulator with XRE-family HTH domain
MANLLQLMEKSGLNRNQISKISGISNTFLAKVERTEKGGEKINIRRKTLINIAVSLNLSLEEINSLLIEYGHTEVSTSDTPYFLAASENQTVTGILPLFSSLALEWFLIGMEKKLSSTEGSSLVYALDQPSHTLKSPEHASLLNEMDFSGKKVLPVHKDLVESACIHRRKLITEALEKGNRISTYICSNCFERYMRGWERYKGMDIEDKYKMFLREHIQALIKYIETYPDRYKLKLLKKCPRIRYEMLYMPVRNKQGKVENKISKVFFLGRDSECNKDRRIIGWSDDFSFGQGFGNLIGFATDLQNLLDFFHKQHTGLKDNFVDSRFEDPEKMVEHIRELMFKNIPENDH